MKGFESKVTDMIHLYIYRLVVYYFPPYVWTCAPREDSDQPAHSRSLIRIFTGCILDSQGCKDSSCGQRRLWSDCADAQADLSLRWALMSEGMFHVAFQFSTVCVIYIVESYDKDWYIETKQNIDSESEKCQTRIFQRFLHTKQT